MAARHTWSPPYRKEYRTERVCLQCGIVKVTRHEPASLPWQEFEFKGRKVNNNKKTPACGGDYDTDTL